MLMNNSIQFTLLLHLPGLCVFISGMIRARSKLDSDMLNPSFITTATTNRVPEEGRFWCRLQIHENMRSKGLELCLREVLGRWCG